MEAMALANNSRPSAALAVGAAVVATAAHNPSAAAHAAIRRKLAGGTGTVDPLLAELKQDNNIHRKRTVNFCNSCVSVGHRVGRTLSSTVTGAKPAVAAAVDGEDCAGLAEFVEQAAISTTQVSADPIRLRRSQTRMHLPNQNLCGFGGGDTLTAGCSEPHRIAFVQRSSALECDFTAGDEQV